MHQGDYSSAPYYHYPQNPNPAAPPPPSDHLPINPYASAPPFITTGSYAPSDYYPQNPDPAPTYAPAYNPPPPISAPNLNPPSQSSAQSPPFDPYQPPIHQNQTQNQNQNQNQSHSYYSQPFDHNQNNHHHPNYNQNPSPAPNNPSSGLYSAPENPSAAPSSFSGLYSAPENPSAAPSSFSGHYSAPYAVNPVDQYQNSGKFDAQYQNLGKFDAPYQNSGKFDAQYQNSGKFDVGGYYRSDLGVDLYGKRSDSGSIYESGGSGRDDGYGDGVYAYQGGKAKSEPYGARGTAPKSGSSTLFDDYGRPVSFGNSGKEGSGGGASAAKIVRAVPKVEVQQDVKGGVQKFRVKLLAESGGQSTMDVLCQVGLDGIRMLDPSTSRTLRIYPLETVTRCDVTDSSTFAFWSKSSVDLEPRRIRLQSNSYTTNTILDTVTAATIQFKEMGGRSRPAESYKIPEQPTDRKKGITDWVSKIKPANEEKDHWVPDEAVTKCSSCGTDFGAFVRKHHCRNCGEIFCDKCTQGRVALTAEENAQPVRVCDRCMAEVTHRLSNAKEAASKPAGLQSHEDLAKKLQEEMERNRISSSGSKSATSGKRMREVECPTCTVHLQVQVPSSGSETIECGVCQHPFLVSAH